MIDDTLLEAEEKMERAIEHAKEEFGGIRTGRANAAMFSRIVIDYYGSPTRCRRWRPSRCPSRAW